MIEWLSEIFSENSDKARLVAILLSALVAILVLLLNQHFANKRARKELLIEKIEEAYKGAIAYERHARKLLSVIRKGGRDERGNFLLDKTLVEAMNDEVDDIEMIIGLHFPQESFDKKKYYAGPTLPVLEIAVKQKRITEDESIEAAMATQDNIKNNSQEIKELCAKLMKIYRH